MSAINWIRLIMGVSCAIVFGPALALMLRGRKRLQKQTPEESILLYRMWEGQ